MISQRLSFILFHCVLSAVVFYESVSTMIHAFGGSELSRGAIHLGMLAAVESIAAILFLIPKTLRVGGILLLIIFAIAIVVHGIRPELPLFVYATGVIFVMTHGNGF